MRANITIADHPRSTNAFDAELRLCLSRELSKGSRTFSQLVAAAEGAYPSDVLAALKNLEQVGIADFSSKGLSEKSDVVACSNRSHLFQSPSTKSSATVFPEPHPLDFDWRFARETLVSLSRRVRAQGVEPVAILGAPTLYKHLVDSGVEAWLFDKNDQVVTKLKDGGYQSITHCDLFDFREIAPRYGCAIADPPWYVEHYQAFLDAASRLMLPGGQLFVSILPRLTRPSALTDRFRILENAFQVGFDLKEVVPSVLQYQSPPFEAEALRAEGIFIDGWRTGDLFVFTRRDGRRRKNKWPMTKDRDRWESVLLGDQTIKIRVHQTSDTPFDFGPASPTGDLRLHSVSRRSPTRSHVDLWTSRNLALKVSNPTVAIEALRKFAGGSTIQDVLALISYEYQLSNTEKERLHELIKLLTNDTE